MAEAAPTSRQRPISPHLWAWRWHVTMAASILHRATGAALYGGALILAGWALALASGPGAYGAYMRALGSVLGRIAFFVLTVSILFHLANGVRHLFWDAGKGFEPKTADATAVIALVFALAGAMALWLVAAAVGAL